MLDELARYNRERWEELAQAGVEYSRPVLDFTPETAQRYVDAHGVMGDVAGRNVLFLAGGGGQQSAAFGVLGTRVTVLDLCETQLERDREAARHYGYELRTIPGDMRDLSCLPENGFDVVWHAHSLAFVPDAGEVFDQVARVVRPKGLYYLSCSNPFAPACDTSHWTGRGYAITRPYGAGEYTGDLTWDLEDFSGQHRRIQGPREFDHTLGGIVNGLIARGFVLLGIWEDGSCDINAPVGTLPHLGAYIPWALCMWAQFRPDFQGTW